MTLFTSRRQFLQQTSAATAAGLLAGLPWRRAQGMSAADFMVEPDEELFHALALKALDAARAAGATFADIRVTGGHSVDIRTSYYRNAERWTPPSMTPPSLSFNAGFGVRALVGGAWGFCSGHELTVDAVVRSAQAAVELARANRPLHRTALELAPAPKVENGRWATTIERDPFVVPFGEQADVQLAACAEVGKLSDIANAGVGYTWTRILNVFASTEGSMITQRRDTASVNGGVRAMLGEDDSTLAEAQIETFKRGGYGYEAVTGTNVVAELRQAADRAIAKAKTLTPPKSVEVGRYDVVLSANAMARVLEQTLAPALDLELALGYRANGDGTSFLAPPEQMLGAYHIGPSNLTIRADRTRPHGSGTVGWDDEGIAPDEYTIVQDGVVTDYHTNRQTAPELAAWYKRQRQPMRSHGCAFGCGQALPRVGLPNLTIVPGRETATLDDIIADTPKGVYIDSLDRASTDQQLLNTQFTMQFYQFNEARAIRNGKLGARLKDVAVQFIAPQFWKGLDVLGGPTSVKSAGIQNGVNSPYPMQPWSSSGSMVPARAKQVNILNIGRTA